TGEVTASGGVITLVDANDITLGDIIAGGDLAVTATDIEISSGAAIDFGATNLGASLTNAGGDDTVLGVTSSEDNASSFELTNAELERINTDTLTFESNDGDVTVNGIGLSGSSITIAAGSGAVAFQGGATEVKNLTVSDAASITQDADGTLAI